jgi:hypothetical protein
MPDHHGSFRREPVQEARASARRSGAIVTDYVGMIDRQAIEVTAGAVRIHLPQKPHIRKAERTRRALASAERPA